MSTIAAQASEYNHRFVSLLATRTWVRRVGIMLEVNSCVACQHCSDTVAIHELPVLPHADCIRRGGCACWYAAISH